MSDFRKEIFDYIDGKMSSSETNDFFRIIESNNELEEEYMLIKDLHDHMIAKFIVEDAETDPGYDNLSAETEKFVSDFGSNEKKNIRLLSYLSKTENFDETGINNELSNFENDKDYNEIDALSKELVQNYIDNDEKDQSILNFIKSSGLNEDDDHLRDKKDIEIRKTKNNFRRIIVWASSAAAALIFVFILLHNFHNTPVKERILTEYHPYPAKLNSLSIRDPEFTVNEKFNNAVLMYNEKKYDEACLQLNDIFEKDTAFVQVLFYSGLAEFENGRYEKASVVFKRTIDEYNEYNIEAKWFLSLCYILTDNNKEAEELLSNIASQENIFKEKALQLLEELDK